MILNSVRHHNHFITQGNYVGYMFRLLISHLQAYFVDCVTRCYAQVRIPSCLHSWKYIISFTQGIYTYIPETNYVPREYSIAAILLLLFMVLISLVSVLNLLYSHISTFRSMCAVPNVAVFCSSLT
jgi:hypothetical protein